MELIPRQFLLWLVLIPIWQARMIFWLKIAILVDSNRIFLCTIIVLIGIVWVDHFFSTTKNL